MRLVIICLVSLCLQTTISATTKLISLPSCFCLVLTDSVGNPRRWNTYGDAKLYNHCAAAIRTCNGGFALTGVNKSCRKNIELTTSTGNTVVGRGGCWLLVTDGDGNELWNQCYAPDSGYSNPTSLTQIDDGSFVLAGFSFRGIDHWAWLMQVSESGELLWSHTYIFPGNSQLYCQSLIRSMDGGFVLIGGVTEKNVQDIAIQGKSTGVGWILKTDSSGEQQWLRTYGSAHWNMFYDIVETPDGCYMAAGELTRGDSLRAKGDGWLMKVDMLGNILAEKEYGQGTGIRFRSIKAVDSGFILGGEICNRGPCDFLLMRTNDEGDSLWSRRAGGEADEGYCSAFPIEDGGYLLAGNTHSNNPNSERWSDCLGVRFDSLGNRIWSLQIGCQRQDQFRVAGSIPGGFFFAGTIGDTCKETEVRWFHP